MVQLIVRASFVCNVTNVKAFPANSKSASFSKCVTLVKTLSQVDVNVVHTDQFPFALSPTVPATCVNPQVLISVQGSVLAANGVPQLVEALHKEIQSTASVVPVFNCVSTYSAPVS